MDLSRIVNVILLLPTILVFIIFRVSDGIANFCLATSLFVSGVTDVLIQRKRSSQAVVFRIRSTQWIFGIAAAMFLVYSFADDEMTMLNVVAVAESVAYGALSIFGHRFSIYRFEEEGIRNLGNDDFLAYAAITAVRVDDTSIAIDTLKHQNDLVVKRGTLQAPTWGEFVSHVSKMPGQRLVA